MANIKIGSLSIDPASYGSQGNAVLGIRDSGKTYTATYLAERIFEAGIPFIAFDPIGVWRFLRIPGKGKGYPIVVAGGQEGDLPLTVAGAPEIVRAAMRNGVSLVIDLFDINLSKADWKRIVMACVRVLLHENSKHGLRHVFIEEAAEFAPQRVGPDQGQVYAEIEKLARMGGNARLGYTLINQRAEEVNKAVLELCDNLFLHRQKGRNSLTALSKWLDIGNVTDHKKIIESLSTLETGKCWAWMAGDETAHLIKVPEKNSLHPDRRVMRGDKEIKIKSPVNVSSFITSMKTTLTAVEQEAAQNDPEKLRQEIRALKKQLASPAQNKPISAPEIGNAQLEKAYRAGYDYGCRTEILNRGPHLKKLYAHIEKLHGMADDLKHLAGWIHGPEQLDQTEFIPGMDEVKKFFKGTQWTKKQLASFAKPLSSKGTTGNKPLTLKSSGLLHKESFEIASHDTNSDALNGPQKRIIESLLFWKSVGQPTPTRAQVALVAGYAPSGGAFSTPAGSLVSMGRISIPGQGLMSIAEGGYVGDVQKMTAEQAKTKLLSVLNGPQKKIIDAMLYFSDAGNEGEAVSRELVAERSGYAAEGGAFSTPAGALVTLRILEKPGTGLLKMADWAVEVLA